MWMEEKVVWRWIYRSRINLVIISNFLLQRNVLFLCLGLFFSLVFYICYLVYSGIICGFLSLFNGCLVFCFLIIYCRCIERDIFDLTPSYKFFLLSSHSQQFLGICCINNDDICETVLHFTLSLCYFVLGSNPEPCS